MRVRLLSAVCWLVVAGAVLTIHSQAIAVPDALGAAPDKVLSPPAKAEAQLPGAQITIDYGAPSVRGRKIFGGQVPYGKVWRTGANPATAFKTTGDLLIGDLKVPAGDYTLYTLPTESGWQLIINKQTGQWGTEYDEKRDLGRTAMIVGHTSAPVELMKIDFEKTMGSATKLHVIWADTDASVNVSASK